MAKIKVIIKEPGKEARLDYIENTLEAIQKMVDGYIETLTFASDAVIICDEEGKFKDKPYNCHLFGQDYVGTIIIAGVDGDSFSDFAPTVKDPLSLFSWMENIDGKR